MSGLITPAHCQGAEQLWVEHCMFWFSGISKLKIGSREKKINGWDFFLLIILKLWKIAQGRVWWRSCVIEALRRQRRVHLSEFQDNQRYIMRSWLKNKKGKRKKGRKIIWNKTTFVFYLVFKDVTLHFLLKLTVTYSIAQSPARNSWAPNHADCQVKRAAFWHPPRSPAITVCASASSEEACNVWYPDFHHRDTEGTGDQLMLGFMLELQSHSGVDIIAKKVSSETKDLSSASFQDS